jgi:hypothetical protein
MSRWGVRILGLVMLLVFALVFLQMYKQLQQVQRMQPKPAATQTQ